MSRLDIVSIGEPMIEFNQTRPGEPHYLQGYGGDSSNMIIAAARQGAKAAYVTRLGEDTCSITFAPARRRAACARRTCRWR